MEDLVKNMQFWQGKKVFITGHTGFKGSWLSFWLAMLGAEVRGFSDKVENNSLFSLASIGKFIASTTGDIRDLKYFTEVMTACEPEVVFHLAAQSLVRPSYADPVSTFSTNIMGTVNLLEAVRKVGSVKAVVIVTSDKCYENRECVWGYRENEPMGGHDPYSASKGCAELVTSAYRRSFFLNKSPMVATARAGNVVGGGDWSLDRIVPDIIRSISNGKPVLIRNPDAVRPWQHVCEPLLGYLMLAECLYDKGKDFTGSWNFGPDDDGAKSVSWLVDYICGQWGNGATWQYDPRDHPHEANYLKLDCSKAKAEIGWLPRLDISTALDWTVNWYKEFFSGKDVRMVIESQLLQYSEICKGG